MGYAVKKTAGKKRNWKLLFETSRSNAAGKRIKSAPAIPIENWGLHGFRPNMTIEEARGKAATLNASAEEKRLAEKKIRITEKGAIENLSLAVAVPDEMHFIAWCEEEHRIEFSGPNKLESHWQCAKRLLKGVPLEPKEYFTRRRKIYRWFQDRSLSLAYMKKVLRFLNLYGECSSQLYGTYFKALPYPTGQDKQDINNAHRKGGGPSKEAFPLSHEKLIASEGKWDSRAQYNWLYLSLWLGLRPEEVDNLKDRGRYRWETDSNGVSVLVVYQTKLERSVDEKNRWKYIPLLYPEQRGIAAIIESGELERPLVKTIRRHLGPGYGTYSGRKGFEDILVKRGQPFQFVSAILGHQKPDITYQKYMIRNKARYEMPKK